MAGPGICVLCLADTCTSEVHPVFNPVAPYHITSGHPSTIVLVFVVCYLWLSRLIFVVYQ